MILYKINLITLLTYFIYVDVFSDGKVFFSGLSHLA
jgi:hypothetical protein